MKKEKIIKRRLCDCCWDNDHRRTTAKYQCPRCGYAYCEQCAEISDFICQECSPRLEEIKSTPNEN